MKSLSNVLQDADPVRHEAPLGDSEREQMRLAILRKAPVNESRPPVRAGLMFVAAVAVMAIGVVAVGYEMWVRGATPLLAAVRFEVRLAEEKPIPGLVVAQPQMSDAGRLIYLHPETVVSNDDIAQAWVTQDGPDRFGVVVHLLPAGAERMREATAAHIGRPVAILIDGNVVLAPVVRSAIGESAVISGDYTKAEAERIAEGIGRR